MKNLTFFLYKPLVFRGNALISLLEKAKLARKISDGKNEILRKFLSHKI